MVPKWVCLGLERGNLSQPSKAAGVCECVYVWERERFELEQRMMQQTDWCKLNGATESFFLGMRCGIVNLLSWGNTSLLPLLCTPVFQGLHICTWSKHYKNIINLCCSPFQRKPTQEVLLLELLDGEWEEQQLTIESLTTNSWWPSIHPGKWWWARVVCIVSLYIASSVFLGDFTSQNWPLPTLLSSQDWASPGQAGLFGLWGIREPII